MVCSKKNKVWRIRPWKVTYTNEQDGKKTSCVWWYKLSEVHTSEMACVCLHGLTAGPGGNVREFMPPRQPDVGLGILTITCSPLGCSVLPLMWTSILPIDQGWVCISYMYFIFDAMRCICHWHYTEHNLIFTFSNIFNDIRIWKIYTLETTVYQFSLYDKIT